MVKVDEWKNAKNLKLLSKSPTKQINLKRKKIEDAKNSRKLQLKEPKNLL